MLKVKADSAYKGRLIVQGVSQILGMSVTRDHEYIVYVCIYIYIYIYIYITEDVVQRYGMEGCNPAYTPRVGPELSLNQPGEKLLDGEEKWRYQAITGVVMYLAQVTRYDILFTVNQLARAMPKPANAHMGEKRRYQAITGAVMYLAQVTRYDILYTVNQLARAMPKPAKAHMGAAKLLLRYLVRSTDFSIITYKQSGFRLAVFADANWGNSPNNVGLGHHTS